MGWSDAAGPRTRVSKSSVVACAGTYPAMPRNTSKARSTSTSWAADARPTCELRLERRTVVTLSTIA